MKWTVQRLIDVLRLYFKSKLTEEQENIIGDPLSTEFLRHSSVLRRLDEVIDSSEVFKSYGPAEVLLKNLEDFQNFPNNFQLLHTTDKLKYDADHCPHVYREVQCPEFVAKSEIYQIIVEKLLEDTICPHVRKFNRTLAIAWANRIQRDNLKYYELVSREHVLAMLREAACGEKTMDDILRAKQFKKKWDAQSVREKLAEFFDTHQDKDLLTKLRRVINEYTAQFPADKNPNSFQQMVDNFDLVNTMAKNLVYHNPACVKPFDKCKKIAETLDIGLRCFIDKETMGSFSLVKEVEVVISAVLKSRNKKPLKAGTIQLETAEEKKLGIVKTMSDVEVVKTLKRFGIEFDGIGVHYVNEYIRRTSDDVVIPTISYHSRHCKLAYDTFVEFFEDVAVSLRLFETVKREYLQNIIQYFEKLEIFDETRKNRYFIDMAEVEKRREEALDFLGQFAFLIEPPHRYPNEDLDATNATAIADEIRKMCLTIDLDSKTLESIIFQFRKKGNLEKFTTGHLVRILTRCARIQVTRKSQKLSKFAKAQYPQMFDEMVQIVAKNEPVAEIEAVEIVGWEKVEIEYRLSSKMAMLSKDGRKFFDEETVFEMCLDRIYKSQKKEDLKLVGMILGIETSRTFGSRMIEESDAEKICAKFLEQFQSVDTKEGRQWAVELAKPMASGLKVTPDENFDMMWEGIIDESKMGSGYLTIIRDLTEQKWKRVCAEDPTKSITKHYFGVMLFCTHVKNASSFEKGIDCFNEVLERVSVLQCLDGKGEDGEWRICGNEVVETLKTVLRKDYIWNSTTKDLLESWERQWYVDKSSTITLADVNNIVTQLAITNRRFHLIPTQQYSKQLPYSEPLISGQDREADARKARKEFASIQKRRNILDAEPEKRYYPDDKILEIFKMVCPTIFKIISMQNFEPCAKLELRAKSVQDCYSKADFSRLIELLQNRLNIAKLQEDFKNLFEFQVKNGEVVYRKYASDAERVRMREEVLKKLEAMKNGAPGAPKFIDMQKKDQVSEVIKKSGTMKTVLEALESPLKTIRSLRATAKTPEKSKINVNLKVVVKDSKIVQKKIEVLEKPSESTPKTKPADKKKSPKPTISPKSKVMPRDKLVKKIKENVEKQKLDEKIREASDKSPKTSTSGLMKESEMTQKLQQQIHMLMEGVQKFEESLKILKKKLEKGLETGVNERSFELHKKEIELLRETLTYCEEGGQSLQRLSRGSDLLKPVLESIKGARKNKEVVEDIYSKVVEAFNAQKEVKPPLQKQLTIEEMRKMNDKEISEVSIKSMLEWLERVETEQKIILEALKSQEITEELLKNNTKNLASDKAALQDMEKCLSLLRQIPSEEDSRNIHAGMKRVRNQMEELEGIQAVFNARKVVEIEVPMTPLSLSPTPKSSPKPEKKSDLVIDVPTTPLSLSPSPKNSPKLKKSFIKNLASEPTPTKMNSKKSSPKKKKDQLPVPEVVKPNEIRRVSEDSGCGAEVTETKRMRSMQKNLEKWEAEAKKWEREAKEVKYEYDILKKKKKDLESSSKSTIDTLQTELTKSENRIRDLFHELNNDQNSKDIISERVRNRHENAISELRRTNADALKKANNTIGSLQAEVNVKDKRIDELATKLENEKNEKNAEIRELRRELAREKAEKEKIRSVEQAKFDEKVEAIKKDMEEHKVELEKDVLRLMLENSEQKAKLDLNTGIDWTLKEQNEKVHYRNVYLKEKNQMLQRTIEELKTQQNLNTVLFGNHRSSPQPSTSSAGSALFHSNVDYSFPPPNVEAPPPLFSFSPTVPSTSEYFPRSSTGSKYSFARK